MIRDVWELVVKYVLVEEEEIVLWLLLQCGDYYHYYYYYLQMQGEQYVVGTPHIVGVHADQMAL